MGVGCPPRPSRPAADGSRRSLHIPQDGAEELIGLEEREGGPATFIELGPVDFGQHGDHQIMASGTIEAASGTATSLRAARMTSAPASPSVRTTRWNGWACARRVQDTSQGARSCGTSMSRVRTGRRCLNAIRTSILTMPCPTDAPLVRDRQAGAVSNVRHRCRIFDGRCEDGVDARGSTSSPEINRAAGRSRDIQPRIAHSPAPRPSGCSGRARG
jgi:hypothetical protein